MVANHGPQRQISLKSLKKIKKIFSIKNSFLNDFNCNKFPKKNPKTLRKFNFLIEINLFNKIHDNMYS